MHSVSEFFDWFDRSLAPPNSPFVDLRHANPDAYPHLSQLWIVLPVAVGLLLLRVFVEKVFFKRFALYMGLKEGKKKPDDNPILKSAFKKSKKPSEKTVKELALQTKLTEKEVSRWFTLSRNYEKPDTVTRFQEACWRFLYYTVAFVASVAVLSNYPWFYNSDYCWIGYPENQPLDVNVQAIYVIQLGFYVSLIFSQFTDVKRKDFWQMFIHHIVTVFLVAFSYHTNFVRIGTLVLLVHDVSDIFMEAAKIAKYLKYQKLCDTLFTVFAVVFFTSRLILYPFVVIRSALIDSIRILQCGSFFGHTFFNALLLILQVLHVFWFSIIFTMVLKFVRTGEVEKDERSDSEDDEPAAAKKNK